jgi:hypothetical protein
MILTLHPCLAALPPVVVARHSTPVDGDRVRDAMMEFLPRNYKDLQE